MLKRAETLLKISTVCLLLLGAGCSGDDPAGPGDPPADTTPPADVADLAIQSVEGSVVTIGWTAPGDDGDEGRAAQYDIRWSFAPINAGNWAAATQVADAPAPTDAGTAQTAAFDVAAKAEVHVALMAADEVPNWSGLSNVPSETFSDLFVARQLTTQGDNNYPHVDNGVVVWVRDLGLDGEEIYMYDLEDPSSIITRKTGSGGEKRFPTNHDSFYVVWSGRETVNDDWEIHSCSTPGMCQLTQVTDNEVEDVTPIAMGTGRFVWEQYSGFFAEIMYHQPGFLDSSVSDDCCPLYDWTNSEPDADGDWVVWRALDAGVTESRVHLRNVVTGAHYDLTDTVVGNEFSLADGGIAFRGAVGADLWIKYWDGSDVHEIAEGSTPSLSEGRVAYEVWAGDSDVHYWDGTTIHEIAVTQIHEAQPSLHGDWLVWAAQVEYAGPNQIFYMRVRDSKRGD